MASPAESPAPRKAPGRALDAAGRLNSNDPPSRLTLRVQFHVRRDRKSA